MIYYTPSQFHNYFHTSLHQNKHSIDIKLKSQYTQCPVVISIQTHLCFANHENRNIYICLLKNRYAAFIENTKIVCVYEIPTTQNKLLVKNRCCVVAQK